MRGLTKLGIGRFTGPEEILDPRRFGQEKFDQNVRPRFGIPADLLDFIAEAHPDQQMPRKARVEFPGAAYRFSCRDSKTDLFLSP